MFGKGLLTGMSVTIKHFLGEKSTVFYPEEKLEMPERFRGGHLLVDGYKCIGCKLCEMGCPNKALSLTVAVDENKKRHMQKYIHHMGRCMYCDLCIEACPTKAITWDKKYANATWFKEDLDHECLKDPPKPIETPAQPTQAAQPAQPAQVAQPVQPAQPVQAAPVQNGAEVKTDA